MGRGPNKTLHMLVLGFLARESTHPYRVVSGLEAIHADQWTKLNPSAIYYTVQKLEEKGYVESVTTTREARRPEKTVFEITDEGRRYLATLLEERIADLVPMHPPIYPALIYAAQLDPETLREAVSRRMGGLSQAIVALERALERYRGGFGEPLRQLLTHAVLLNRAELGWCEGLLEATRSGALYDTVED